MTEDQLKETRIKIENIIKAAQETLYVIEDLQTDTLPLNSISTLALSEAQITEINKGYAIKLDILKELVNEL